MHRNLILPILLLSLVSCSDSSVNRPAQSSSTTVISSSSGAPLSSGGALSSSTTSSSSANDSSLVWQKANLTNYISYPDPGSEECIVYNGCEWAGWFAALDDQQTPEWVQANNIISVHEKDFDTLKLKTLRLRQGGQTIDAVVYDKCADSDCAGCCTTNATQNGHNFLIDIEINTMSRFGGRGDGIVEWTCLDC